MNSALQLDIEGQHRTLAELNIEGRKPVARGTAIDQVNKPIDWYAANKPESGMRIEVNVSAKDLHKMLGLDALENVSGGRDRYLSEHQYRGRTLVAVGK